MRNKLKYHLLTAVCLTGFSVFPFTAAAQTVFHNTNGIIDARACIGNSCDALPSFSQEPLTLRWTNTGIIFEDSSTSDFPDNDFAIIINDSGGASGTAEYFSIMDITAGLTPFTVSAGARQDALFIDEDGRIGFGTDTPTRALHIVDDFPGIVFDAPDTGFGAQEWSFSAGPTGISLSNLTRDAGFFTVPTFLFDEDMRTYSFVIDEESRVGFGLQNPEESVHVRGNSGESTSFMLENIGVGGAGDGRWEFVMRKADGEFAINDADTPGGDFIFTGPSDQVNGSTAISIFNPTRGARWDMETRGSDGDFAIDDRRTTGAADFIFRSSITNDPDGAGLFINGKVVTTGSCSMGCDAVFDADYDLPTIEEHAEEMFAKKHLPTVGPTESGQIDVTQKMLTMLNELEKAHIYIAELNEEKKALAARLEALEAKVGQ